MMEVTIKMDEEERIFDAIEPALDAAGFRVDDGYDDTIYVTSQKSGKSFVITVSEEEEEE